MSNSLLAMIVLAVLAWAFVIVPAPEPVSRSVVWDAIERPAAPSPTNAAINDLQPRRPPVPLVRNLPAMLVPPVASESATLKVSSRVEDDWRRKAAAKTAIEADGYKSVTMLGRSADGTWRATAYRGTMEVRLIVDNAGAVSAE